MIKVDKSSIVLTRRHQINYGVYFLDHVFKAKKHDLLKEFCKNKAFIVIDSLVYKYYGGQIIGYFNEIKADFKIYIFEANEKNKNIESVMRICEEARSFKIKRNSVFIGIGGGITMDVVGFAASIFRRKTNYIRIPTTLLGMVDAGVGIKVGVNFSSSKNLLGSYHAPIASFNDQVFLKTLKISEIRNGLFEIIKMALIADLSLFEMVENHYRGFLKKIFNLQTSKINHLASALMMRFLEPNLYEHNLKREVDFGHTFSQFIEESSGYTIRHGEAVGIDMLISSYLSYRRGILEKNDFDRITDLCKEIGGINHFHLIDAKGLHDSLESIRAHRAGDLNLVLPKKIGKGIFTQKCDLDEIEEALNYYKKFSF